MRIIFLNSWFGKAGEPFLDFIKDESAKTDIYCLVEVSPHLYSNLSKKLPGFNGFYQKGLNSEVLKTVCGQTIFLRKDINVEKEGKITIYRQSDEDVGFMQFSELKVGKKTIWLGNVHGKSLPGDKLDTPVRLQQSGKIIDFFAQKKGLKIIGGDFNLNPDTKSIAMFEAVGYINLIKKFDIKNTRNHLSWEQAERQSKEEGKKFFGRQHFADYVFVSPEVKIIKFEVPYSEVSDHLPQILEFDL